MNNGFKITSEFEFKYDKHGQSVDIFVNHTAIGTASYDEGLSLDEACRNFLSIAQKVALAKAAFSFLLQSAD